MRNCSFYYRNIATGGAKFPFTGVVSKFRFDGVVKNVDFIYSF